MCEPPRCCKRKDGKDGIVCKNIFAQFVERQRRPLAIDCADWVWVPHRVNAAALIETHYDEPRNLDPDLLVFLIYSS